MLKKIHINRNAFVVAYKLLHDALLLMLVSFAGMLIAEGLLPGLITNKISYSKMMLAVIFILAAIAYLGKSLDITYHQEKLHKGKFISALVLFSFILLGNSMLKFTLWENMIITLTTLLVFFLFHELIFTGEPE